MSLNATGVLRVQIEILDIEVYPEKMSLLSLRDDVVEISITVPNYGWKVGKQWIQISNINLIEFGELNEIQIFHKNYETEALAAKIILHDLQIVSKSTANSGNFILGIYMSPGINWL